jgi:hypothetical protein
MINLNFSLKIESIGSAENRANLIAGLLAFQNEAKAAGLHLSAVAPSLPRSTSAPSTVKHGPYETQWLAQSGRQRMKLPTNWSGSREEYALSQLNGPAYFNESGEDDTVQEEHEDDEDPINMFAR